MLCKQTRALVPLLALIALLSLLSGCGANMIGRPGSARATPIISGNLPDSVQISLGGPGIAQAPPPQLTLHTLTLVQQLYKTMLALPSMPPNMACPADAGPSYQLAFRSGTQTLAQAEANSGGGWNLALPRAKQESPAPPPLLPPPPPTHSQAPPSPQTPTPAPLPPTTPQ